MKFDIEQVRWEMRKSKLRNLDNAISFASENDIEFYLGGSYGTVELHLEGKSGWYNMYYVKGWQVACNIGSVLILDKYATKNLEAEDLVGLMRYILEHKSIAKTRYNSYVGYNDMLNTIERRL